MPRKDQGIVAVKGRTKTAATNRGKSRPEESEVTKLSAHPCQTKNYLTGELRHG